MKYLILFAIVCLVAWRWRSARDDHQQERRQKKARAQAQPTDMVACRHCGLHLPVTEALPGRLGPYCSAAHRQAAEGG